METTGFKVSRLTIRCNRLARELLNKAATCSHVSVSAFVLSHALAAAKKIILENESITLTPDEFRAFVAALDKPVQPNAALKTAYKRHAAQIVR